MLYSQSSGGFYLRSLHGDAIPADAVEITAEEHAQLLDGQARGLAIVADSQGHPRLQEREEDNSPQAITLRIAARRYQAETAGITINGMPLDTGRDSQAMVTGAALAAVLDPAYRCQWKTATGFIDLDAQQIIAIASAMRAHVQACFDREAALLDALDAGTYTAEQLDQGWPA